MTMTLIPRRILCHFTGHWFKPMYEQIGSTRVYTCQTCGHESRPDGRRQHEKFLREFVPTWGERGSDSQGYREMTNDS